MSLDSTDFWPDFVHNEAYQNPQDEIDITKVSDEDLKAASAYMVDRIRYYIHGVAIGPDDESAAHYIHYMRLAAEYWTWTLTKIERRWKIKHFEA